MIAMFSVNVQPIASGLHRIEACCDRCGQSYSTHVDAPKSCTPQHVDGEWYGFIAGFLVNHECETKP